MRPDSPLGQVISLSDKHLIQPVSTLGKAGATGDAVLRDVLSGGAFDAAVTGFVLAALPDSTDPVLWVSDRMARRENGHLYGPAVRGFGIRAPVLRVEVSHPRDVLWTMEEAAGCAGLSAVVGEIHGAPEVLSFTATKRLALRAEAAQVPIWLIRSGDHGALSAARERWRVRALPSTRHKWNAQAPGAPLWEADLFRARGRAPGVWEASFDGHATTGTDRLRLVPRSGDGPLAQDHRAATHAAGR
tara:strand:+ start:3061 stop:3795 length:735 start_codon:yes stop_codon:yes gene_type:complete